MIIDLVGEVEACLQMAQFFGVFWSCKGQLSYKNCQVFYICWISTPRWWHSASLQMKGLVLFLIFWVIDFIMNILGNGFIMNMPGDGVKNYKDKCLKRRGLQV